MREAYSLPVVELWSWFTRLHDSRHSSRVMWVPGSQNEMHCAKRSMPVLPVPCLRARRQLLDGFRLARLHSFRCLDLDAVIMRQLQIGRVFPPSGTGPDVGAMLRASTTFAAETRTSKTL